METTRRDFLKNTSLLSAGAILLPTIVPENVIGKYSLSNRINIAIIGCGRQTFAPNIPQLLGSQHAQIVAVCDVDNWCLKNAQIQVNDFYSKQKGFKYKGCKTFDNYRKIIAIIDIDAVITRNDREFRTLPKMLRAVELVRNGRIGKIQKIYLDVTKNMNVIELACQFNMLVPVELNYDMWLRAAWQVPCTEKRVHAIKAYGRPGYMRVESFCDGMTSKWGTHFLDIAYWGNNSS
jgi:myo-inositol 2-dehydrogenase / D-chiro-inositol 1-dehydrogenase